MVGEGRCSNSDVSASAQEGHSYALPACVLREGARALLRVGRKGKHVHRNVTDIAKVRPARGHAGGGRRHNKRKTEGTHLGLMASRKENVRARTGRGATRAAHIEGKARVKRVPTCPRRGGLETESPANSPMSSLTHLRRAWERASFGSRGLYSGGRQGTAGRATGKKLGACAKREEEDNETDRQCDARSERRAAGANGLPRGRKQS